MDLVPRCRFCSYKTLLLRLCIRPQNKTGLLFEVGNASELAEHLKKLIDDKHLRRKLGDNAKFKAEKDGDFVKIVEEKIVPIYERFIDS